MALKKGKIKFYMKDKGYGFIEGDEGKDFFVHFTALPADADESIKGKSVEFDTKDTDRGHQAIDVKILEGEESSEYAE